MVLFDAQRSPEGVRKNNQHLKAGWIVPMNVAHARVCVQANQGSRTGWIVRRVGIQGLVHGIDCIMVLQGWRGLNQKPRDLLVLRNFVLGPHGLFD